MKKVHLITTALLLTFTGCQKKSPGEIQPDPDILKAALVKPSERQLAWQETEYNMFIHYFKPVEVDADQWALVCKEAGMKMIVLTCKHHGGFCLWPSEYTDHSVETVEWRDGKGDIVREVADACKKYGLKFGVYLSPWDMHEETYGTPAYDEFFKNQLTELLTNYGEISEVWFDGFYGGPPEEIHDYDWEGYYELIRDLAPDAVIAITGPDVRWVGTESGYGRDTEWSVVGMETEHFHEIAHEFSNITAKEQDLGGRDRIRESEHLMWYPAEVDVSIRPSWGYRESEDTLVKSVEKLLDIYYSSIGKNSVLLLNFPPDKRTGRIHENDVLRAMQLKKMIDVTFRDNLAKGAEIELINNTRKNKEYPAYHLVDQDRDTWWSPGKGALTGSIEFTLDEEITFNRILLQENIRNGQRVEEFSVEVWDGAAWKEAGSGTTIGYKRILRTNDVVTDRIRLNITQARYIPEISEFGLYFEPPVEEIIK